MLFIYYLYTQLKCNPIIYIYIYKTQFILPLKKTNRFLNTIFVKGPKLYYSIMFNIILKTITITHILKLKKYIIY